MPNSHSLISDMTRILETEASMLLTGDLKNLSTLEAEKQKVIDQLAASKVTESANDLGRVRDLAHRNKHLFDAAMSGILAAKSRLENLQEAQSGLKTYKVSGHRAGMTSCSQGRSRRV